MSQITYKISKVDPIGFKKLDSTDNQLVDSFGINTTFNADRHIVELHIYSPDGQILNSDYNYRNESILLAGESAGKEGASQLSLDPQKDAIYYNYENGGIINVYNFLKDLYSETYKSVSFYINKISPDRKEVTLLTTDLTNDQVVKYTEQIQDKLESLSYFNEFRLNFGENDLAIGVNIKTQDFRDFKEVVVKLYKPLSEKYTNKSLLSIQEIVLDSVGFQIDAEFTGDEIQVPYLKGPNFGVENENNNTLIPSEYYNYSELFDYSNINSYRELKSNFEEKGVNLSIDYTDYTDFVNFGSANERLRNFKYKLDLISSYQSSIDSIESSSNNQGGITGSRAYYKDLIDNIVGNFDHYDRHLFYESGSTSWPKENTDRPYLNTTSSATSSWYGGQLESSSNFDVSNNNQDRKSVV